MASSGNDTLAQVFLGMGGKTLFALGTTLSGTGTLYAIWKISGSGINVLNAMPGWLGSRPLTEEEKKTPLLTRGQVVNELTTYAKISGVIASGIAVRMAGNFISNDETIRTLNKMLYGV